jgi:hypothetical protein
MGLSLARENETKWLWFWKLLMTNKTGLFSYMYPGEVWLIITCDLLPATHESTTDHWV